MGEREQELVARGHMEGYKNGLRNATTIVCFYCCEEDTFEAAVPDYRPSHPSWRHRRRAVVSRGPRWIRCRAGAIHSVMAGLWPNLYDGAVAQLAEQGAFTPQAEGSIPSGTIVAAPSVPGDPEAR